MKNALLFRFAAMLVLACLLSSKALQAQNTSGNETRLILKVTGLTSATRDAIASDLNTAGQARLAFACVPAGILILEPVNSGGRQQVRELTLPTIQQRVGSSQITELALSQQQAEEECAQVRDR